MSRCAIKPFSAVGTGMTAIALLCLCALTILSREALAGYRPRPPLAGGAGRGFGPGGRGPVPYGAGGPGRFGPGGQGPGGMRGPGGLMGARGPGPVIPPSLSGPGSQMGVPPAGGAHAGIPGGMPAGGRFDFSSASHWSNFGPGHQYPSVPMGNLQGGLPGAQLPTGEDIAGGALPADDPLTADPSNDLFNYMLQNEDSLSNQAPTSWFARSLDSNESSETASAEGMGVEDGNRDETEGEREKAENDESPPKESNENSVFLAKREDSRKEQGNEEAKKEALKAKETLAHEQLKKKHHKADEAKEEEAKKEEANKSKTDEALDKEETDNGNDDENEEGTSSSGTHKLESHKKESHAEESHKEESHQEEHTSA